MLVVRVELSDVPSQRMLNARCAIRCEETFAEVGFPGLKLSRHQMCCSGL